MMPETWHFPASWRETLTIKGRLWIYRRGLGWQMFGPADAVIHVEVLEESD